MNHERNLPAFLNPVLDFVDRALAQGENVLVHCLAGPQCPSRDAASADMAQPTTTKHTHHCHVLLPVLPCSGAHRAGTTGCLLLMYKASMEPSEAIRSVSSTQMRWDTLRSEAAQYEERRIGAVRCKCGAMWWCDVVRCDMVQCGTLRYGELLCDVVWCGVVLFGTVRCGTMWGGSVQCDMMRFGAVCCCKWCDMMRYDTMRCGDKAWPLPKAVPGIPLPVVLHTRD